MYVSLFKKASYQFHNSGIFFSSTWEPSLCIKIIIKEDNVQLLNFQGGDGPNSSPDYKLQNLPYAMDYIHWAIVKLVK